MVLRELWPKYGPEFESCWPLGAKFNIWVLPASGDRSVLRTLAASLDPFRWEQGYTGFFKKKKKIVLDWTVIRTKSITRKSSKPINNIIPEGRRSTPLAPRKFSKFQQRKHITRVSRFNLDPWPLAPATRFLAGAGHLRLVYLSPSLFTSCFIVLSACNRFDFFGYLEEGGPDRRYDEDESFKSSPCCYPRSIPSFGPSSSDESRGFSRRRKALVFGFISCRTSFWRLCPSLSTVYGASFSTDELNLFVFGEARVPPTTVCCSSSSKRRQILQYHESRSESNR
ncbi:hypothetical protein F2Q69_00054895 [Brassica cretica]|uniref:Uncharacterized protein n=1 Tax=Brassica cretica TaxID=69181 RepID=A0A8S9MS41_BRACR|nr:hypothetical protein F2Q69_00054895 [Brassica cretica]